MNSPHAVASSTETLLRAAASIRDRHDRRLLALVRDGLLPDNEAAARARVRVAREHVAGRVLWTYADIAQFLGVQSDTVRTYRKHRLLPSVDYTENGRPYWYADRIQTWEENRPVGSRRRQGDMR